MYCCVLGASCRWVLPFIGHMGICTSSGIIRDFAGSYFVSVSVAFYLKIYLFIICNRQCNFMQQFILL